MASDQNVRMLGVERKELYESLRVLNYLLVALMQIRADVLFTTVLVTVFWAEELRLRAILEMP